MRGEKKIKDAGGGGGVSIIVIRKNFGIRAKPKPTYKNQMRESRESSIFVEFYFIFLSHYELQTWQRLFLLLHKLAFRIF
jgi:hypothetical protein